LTLVDTNVILDMVTDDPHWVAWSRSQLEVAANQGPLIINDVIYAEVSVRFQTIDVLEAALSGLDIHVVPIPSASLFLAGKAFNRYRLRGGTRTGVLPDFYIGAHAAVRQCVLLTRDPSRYRSYFPTLRLTVPSG
jgi:predicted nucleic acid-binding protein